MIQDKFRKYSFLLVIISIFFVLGVYAAEDEFIYPEYSGRDPFQPLIDEKGALNIRLIQNKEDLVLNGIIYSQEEGESIAILNSEPFREGAVIGNYSLEKIKPNKVILIKGGKEIILKMEEEDEE